MIDVREVDFTYGDQQGPHNISLQMPPRAVTASLDRPAAEDDSAALH
jgi:ABC-type phosphate transport system, ATPase component